MQATAELFKDGYVQTGDVVQQIGPDSVIWIDRRKNIIKLAQVHTALIALM